MDLQFEVARAEFLHAAIDDDAAAVNEHEVREDVLNLFDLVGGEQDGAAAVEVVVQQRIVELFPIEDVETERWLIEHKELRVNGHDEREVELGHHAL